MMLAMSLSSPQTKHRQDYAGHPVVLEMPEVQVCQAVRMCQHSKENDSESDKSSPKQERV